MTDRHATGVLVDSNVLLDLFTDEPAWAEAWSGARLAEALDAGSVSHLEDTAAPKSHEPRASLVYGVS